MHSTKIDCELKWKADCLTFIRGNLKTKLSHFALDWWWWSWWWWSGTFCWSDHFIYCVYYALCIMLFSTLYFHLSTLYQYEKQYKYIFITRSHAYCLHYSHTSHHHRMDKQGKEGDNYFKPTIAPLQHQINFEQPDTAFINIEVLLGMAIYLSTTIDTSAYLPSFYFSQPGSTAPPSRHEFNENRERVKNSIMDYPFTKGFIPQHQTSTPNSNNTTTEATPLEGEIADRSSPETLESEIERSIKYCLLQRLLRVYLLSRLSIGVNTTILSWNKLYLHYFPFPPRLLLATMVNRHSS